MTLVHSTVTASLTSDIVLGLLAGPHLDDGHTTERLVLIGYGMCGR
jgi:hypothetical protein